MVDVWVLVVIGVWTAGFAVTLWLITAVIPERARRKYATVAQTQHAPDIVSPEAQSRKSTVESNSPPGSYLVVQVAKKFSEMIATTPENEVFAQRMMAGFKTQTIDPEVVAKIIKARTPVAKGREPYRMPIRARRKHKIYLRVTGRNRKSSVPTSKS